MSSKALGKLWSFLGLLSSGISVAFLFRAAAADTDAGLVPLGSFSPYGMTTVAIPVGCVIALVVLWLTRRHAGLESGSWAKRLPVFYFEEGEIDPEHPDGRKYQAFFLVAFVIFPVIAQFLLLVKFGGGTAIVEGVRVSRWQHFWPGTNIDWGTWIGGMYMMDGMSYYPILEPWAFTGLVLWLGVSLIRTLRSLGR